MRLQVIVIVSAPVLTRLYSPSEYGILSVATSILFVLITVTCLRYEFAVPLPEDDVEAANLLALSLAANLGMSVAAGVVLWLTGPWLAELFGLSALGHIRRPAGCGAVWWRDLFRLHKLGAACHGLLGPSQ